MSHTISFLRYQAKCLIKFLLIQLMASFFLDQLLKQWLTGRKRGEDKNTKLEYLENKNSFLDEKKNIFHIFEGISCGDK